jgi:hypothetical protein
VVLVVQFTPMSLVSAIGQLVDGGKGKLLAAILFFRKPS